MKKIFLGCLFFSAFVQAQLQWRPLSSAFSNTNNHRFDDVFFLNENLGWAANGESAAVYKTTDGGQTWTTQLNETSLGGNYYFRNIEFLNENIGFVGSLNNLFLKTTDGGDHWNPVTLPQPSPAICGLAAAGPTTIYGCGAYFSPAYIIKSMDSGDTWQYINMSTYATALVEVLFLDELNGYASGSDVNGGVILKTTDGGQTWTSLYNTGIAGEYVWKLQVLSSNHNVIFGSVEANAPNFGKMLRSVDGGQNWVSKPLPYVSVQAIGFMDENHGWMGGYISQLGDNFPILETTDGGDTWTDIGIGSNLNRVVILSDHLAYASGTTIYKYSDTSLSTGSFSESNRIPLKATVSPNPIKDRLNLTVEFSNPDHLVVELYDATGRFIKQLKLDEIKAAGKRQYAFDFPYASGAYLLNLHNNTGRQSIKFMK